MHRLLALLTLLSIFSTLTSIPLKAQGDLDNGVWVGYQAWHSAGEPGKAGWGQWFKWRDTPAIDTIHGDQWPAAWDEYAKLYPTGLTYPDGSPLMVYSSQDYETIDLHIRWMKEYGIKGVAFQRHQNLIDRPGVRDNYDRRANYIRKACEKYGVYFFLMPCNNAKSERENKGVVERFKNDWKHLIDNVKITESPMYARQEGKPVIIMWGLGFDNRPITPNEGGEIVDFFTDGPEQYRVYLGGGLQRGITGKRAEKWRPVYEKLDLVKTWRTLQMIRNGDRARRDTIANVKREKAWCDARGIEYMPSIFAGGSRHGSNHYPRMGGYYYWDQFSVATNNIFKAAESKFIYVAMFDEIEEGVAIYKSANRREALPDPDNMVHLNIDAEKLPPDLQNLPEDWYLQITNEMGKVLAGEQAMTEDLPIRP